MLMAPSVMHGAMCSLPARHAWRTLVLAIAARLSGLATVAASREACSSNMSPNMPPKAGTHALYSAGTLQSYYLRLTNCTLLPASHCLHLIACIYPTSILWSRGKA